MAVLGGRYRLDSVLGRGGMGEVWRGQDLTLDRPVAVKLVPAGNADEETLARFRREAQVAARLSGHPNVVGVFDYGRHQEGAAEMVYIVMELVDGKPLDRLLSSGRPALGDAVEWSLHIARALQAAHAEGVVHRDIKPANAMLVLRIGQPHVVKVLDFGIASLGEQATALTGTGYVLGTFPYMAPELWRGERATAQSDLYALGAVIFELVAGRKAFESVNPAGYLSAHAMQVPDRLDLLVPGIAGLPQGLADLTASLLAKDPRQRPQSATDVADALAACQEALATYAPTLITAAKGTAEPPPAPAQAAPPVERAAVPQWRVDALERRREKIGQGADNEERLHRITALLPEAEAVYGPDDYQYLDLRWQRMEYLWETGRHEDAADEVRALLPVLLPVAEARFGVQTTPHRHDQVLGIRQRGAYLLRNAGHPEEAVEILRDSVREAVERRGPYDEDCQRARLGLAVAIGEAGDREAALDSLRQLIADMRENNRSEGEDRALPARLELGRFLAETGRVPEAVAELEDVLRTALTHGNYVWLRNDQQARAQALLDTLRPPARPSRLGGLFRRR